MCFLVHLSGNLGERESHTAFGSVLRYFQGPFFSIDLSAVSYRICNSVLDVGQYWQSWINHKSLHTNFSDLEKLSYLLLFNNTSVTRLSFGHDEKDRFESIRQEGKITALCGNQFSRSFTNIPQFVKCVLGPTFVRRHRKWRIACAFEWLKKLNKTTNLNWDFSDMLNRVSHLLIQIYMFHKFISKKGYQI